MLRPLTRGPGVASPQSETLYPPPAPTPVQTPGLSEPYPPPRPSFPADQGELTEPSPTLAPQPPFPATPPGGPAATLYGGDIWLLELGQEPRQLTNFGDVAAVFGWNPSGDTLLFGRGRVEQAEYVGDTTQLWVWKAGSVQTQALIADPTVQAASWSPSDDRIAYCEVNHSMTVITLSGERVAQRGSVICDFSWSPDGQGIAVSTYTPDMVSADGLTATVLGVWWLTEDRLQTFTDVEGEGQGWPIWSVNGDRILFQRTFFLDIDQQKLSGSHVVVVATGQLSRLESANPGAQDFVRSPRADLVAYRIGSEIWVTDFEGQARKSGEGQSLQWLPDGRTLLYQPLGGGLASIMLDNPVLETSQGGQERAASLYVQPRYFFVPGG